MGIFLRFFYKINIIWSLESSPKICTISDDLSPTGKNLTCYKYNPNSKKISYPDSKKSS